MTTPSANDPLTLRVLLVEDSPHLAERVREMLAREPGVEVVATVADETSAVQVATEQQVDLLILDLQLREGTGFGVLLALGTRLPPTVVMTNYDMPQFRKRAHALGVEHFLCKADDIERLSLIVSAMRRGHIH